ncbi:MAG: universal stress protein, partial [Gammaproteobacteria bacterium]|nr:universal stress protein [Gammaproteobacteria bacterium]
MEDSELENEMPELPEELEKVFKILVCIDGSEESYRGLRYAARLASGFDTDITLLYVRDVDRELSTDGLDMRISRENMLDWGLELPGMSALKKGLDTLMELGYLEGDWNTETTHIDNSGDPLGDNYVEYSNTNDRKVILKLLVAPSPELGILDEAGAGQYDITIMSSN